MKPDSRRFKLIAIFFLIASFIPAVFAQSSTKAGATVWPQSRSHPRRGISKESGLLKEWPKEGPKMLWMQKDIGDAYSPPAVVGSRIYLMSNRGVDNEFVQALSVQDGKPIWTTRVGNVGNPDQQPPYP